MDPSLDDLARAGQHDLTIRLPSGDVEMSPTLLSALRLDDASMPRALDQWRELCCPADHQETRALDRLIRGELPSLSISRRLYCGDGTYRAFRLDARVELDASGRPSRVVARETPLDAEPAPMPRTDADALEDMREENARLRRALQRVSLACPSWLDDVAAPCPHVEEAERTVGVIGHEGSGKSSLIDALMGERLLPRQAGAIPVSCREGPRCVEAVYRDGKIERIRGRALDARWMASRVAAGRASQVERVTWSGPTSLVPPGTALIDVPWPMARPLLPTLDAVLYVVPIRSTLRPEELDLLRDIVAAGRPVAILLTQIDLERDDTEAGRVLTSRRERLESDVRRLASIATRASLSPCPIVPVSSRLALEGLWDRSSLAWRASGFEPLVRCLADPRPGAAPIDLPPLPPDPGPTSPRGEGLFASLLSSVKEQALRERFLALPAIQGRRAVFLGPRRADALRLLSLLAHDATIAEAGADEGAWLFSGHGGAPFPCVALPPLPDGLEVLVAPSDGHIGSDVDWRAISSRWTPLVCSDLVHADLALSDLARAPYLPALREASRWISASVHGGMFDRRLHDLAWDVPMRVDAFARAHGMMGRMDRFICEGHDPRYTDFLALGAQVEASSSEEDLAALVQLWDEQGLSLEPPFTRHGLALALLGARAAMRAARGARTKDGR